ncbi:hypothetical protein FQN55_007626 [Onygenales sp. PD_40]|nr:hypothetical protein FQN55_007626 [Onygenales sp. PD_40]KAK2792159.1 hypothetical protein FQN52_003927 [Onygenales sp. PD_12]KAK2798267.1 hypothetical protein FQN51_007833 [Onygenales sp. PD_10]
MPPPSNQRADIEPPPQLMQEATKGFFTGAVRFGSISILAHLILLLPHPLRFSSASSTTPTSPTTTTPQPPPRSTSTPSSQPHTNTHTPNTHKPTRTPLPYRPLTWLSEAIAPASRVYRGLTPQFKVFLQLSAMTLGGCIWAEKRVGEYMDVVRRVKRAERVGRER